MIDETTVSHQIYFSQMYKGHIAVSFCFLTPKAMKWVNFVWILSKGIILKHLISLKILD